MTSDVDGRIGNRLRAVRERLGFTLREIADRVGFKCYQTLSSIERGERSVRVAELAELAKTYHKSSWYFLTEDEPAEPSISFAYRTKEPEANMSPVEAEVTQLLKAYRLFEELTGEYTPACLEPWAHERDELKVEDVAERAYSLAKDLDLGFRPASSLIMALEERGIPVFYHQLNSKASAVFATGDLGNVIVVDMNEAPWRRNFSLAHELFHLLALNYFPIESVHSGDDNDVKYQEKLADNFAAALLMPKEAVNEQFKSLVRDGKVNIADLIDLALKFEVSTQALLWRLVNLGLVNKQRVQELIASEHFLEANKKTRVGKWSNPEQFSDRFVRLGQKALRNGKISAGKFCEVFDMTRTRLSQFLAERGYPEDMGNEHDIELDHP